MYDYGFSTLEKYGLTSDGTYRTRGALLCQTEQGLLILREFRGSERKLIRQQELLKGLEEKGYLVDCYLETLEGELIARDRDGIAYTLQHWREGRECDTKSREDLQKSVLQMAKLHKEMQLPFQKDYFSRSLHEEYQRHNQELKKIRKFIRKKGASNVFEKAYLSSVEEFLNRGEEALAQLENSSYGSLREAVMKNGTICHGEYHQHNVWFVKDGVAVVNFGRWNHDIQVSDLYHFLRKIMEKHHWDVALARELLTLYHREKPLSEAEWENLRIRFWYPEKYWKVADYYYSHNKAWISEKNEEKLLSIIQQKKRQEEFLEQCFSCYPF